MDFTPANRVPDNIIGAARSGDTAAVRHWLESGGDPNWNLVDQNTHGFPSHYRLLMFTAEYDLRDVISTLREYHYFTQDRIARYEETLSILEGVRLAGSYKQYVLQDYKHLLRTRSLLARGRALIGPRTPDVVARLFGGRLGAATSSRRATRRRRALPQRPAGVPDPAFWLVMEYWRLGNWRRP